MSETGYSSCSKKESCDAAIHSRTQNGKVTFAEKDPAPGNICANCHADQAAGAGKKFPHAAVEAANCDTDMAYWHAAEMDEKQLCKQCHEDIARCSDEAACSGRIGFVWGDAA